MEQQDFYETMKQFFPKIFDNPNILEFINPHRGHTSCSLFEDIDIYQVSGEINADKFIYSLDGLYSYQPFDVILSTCVLQYDSNWKNSLLCMYRELRRTGLLLIVAAGPNKPPRPLKNFSILQKVKNLYRSLFYWGGNTIANEYYEPITRKKLLQVFGPEMFSKFTIRENSNTHNIEFYGIKR